MNEIIREIQERFGLTKSNVIIDIDDEELKYIIYNLNRYISAKQLELKEKEAKRSKRSSEYIDIELLNSYGVVIAAVMFTVLIICAKMNFYPDYYFNKIVSDYFKKKKIHYEIEALDTDLALFDKLIMQFKRTAGSLDMIKELEKYGLSTNLKWEYLDAIYKKAYGRSEKETLTEEAGKKALSLDMLIESRKRSNQQHANLDNEIKRVFSNIEVGTTCIDIDTDQNSVCNHYKTTMEILDSWGEKCGEGVPGQLFDKYASMVWNVTSGVDTTGELIENLCKLLCECFRYFVLIGINPSEMIRTSVLKYNYSEYSEKFSEYMRASSIKK